MTQPPPVPESPEPAGRPASTDGENPGHATPYLLVMPPVDGAPPTMVWPGAEGTPAWAIPVSIPAGTRGYAVFIPLVPAAAPTPTGTDTGPAAAPPTPAAPDTGPAAAPPTPAHTDTRPAVEPRQAGGEVRPAVVPRQADPDTRPAPTAAAG
ncbi:DUF4173 domain-containing protein, partial [Micromonospora sp. NPDC000018]